MTFPPLHGSKILDINGEGGKKLCSPEKCEISAQYLKKGFFSKFDP